MKTEHQLTYRIRPEGIHSVDIDDPFGFFHLIDSVSKFGF